MYVSLGIAVLALSIGSPAAAQVTRYVSPSGSDSNPGTALQPLRTIQRAADLVNAGDTVIVEDGVYTGVGTNTPCASNSRPIVCISRGGVAGAPVTFRARNPRGAKLDGQRNTSTDGIRLIGQAHYVKIEGFEIYGVGNASGSSNGIEIYAAGRGSIITQNDIHDVGRLCTDTTNGQAALFVQQPDVTITRNRIHDIGRYAAGENSCQPSTAYYKNHDHGIYADGQSSGSAIPGAANILIANNLFWNHARGWAIQMYPGTLASPSIVNNTFAFPNPYVDGHIIIGANTIDGRLLNNIFYSPRTTAIYYYTGTPTNLQVTNNMVHGASLLSRTPSGTSLASNQTADPQLANVTSAPYDLHLTAPSLAINAAVTLPEVTIDFDGLPRAAGVADVGAFEYADGTAIAQVATPAISPNGGTITGPTTVTLATATSGAAIRYTTDGSTPTSSSPLYSAAFTIDASVTIMAQAFKSGMLDSLVATTSFQKNQVDPAPSPSPSADTTPPTVAIDKPLDQARIATNGPVTISATASDNVKIASVKFSLDGRTIATDTAAPYATSYKFNKVGAGQHVLTATATDSAGNTASASITIWR